MVKQIDITTDINKERSLVCPFLCFIRRFRMIDVMTLEIVATTAPAIIIKAHPPMSIVLIISEKG